jgi:hypothetical protein
MSRLAKLNLIVGGLVLILAVALGTVVTEFAAGVGRVPSLKDRQTPRARPGVQAPVRSGPPVLRACKVQWS